MSQRATSYNRAYLATCLRHSTQIQPDGWTSDTLGTLDEMLTSGQKIKTVDDYYLRKEMNNEMLDYANWVPKKMLIAFLMLTLLFGGLTFLPVHIIVRVVFALT